MKMDCVAMLASIAAPQPGHPPVPAAMVQGEARCVAAFRYAVAQGAPGGVAAGCWRVGPIWLGMREAEVERRLSAPVAATDVLTTESGPSRRYHATLYAFPSSPGPLVNAGRARMRLVELRYEGNWLAAIDNAPGARIDGYECPTPERRAARGSEEVELSARTGPLLRFAEVEVGDPLISLQRHFGGTPSRNASNDWYSYLPVPISFDGDPERATITGFAIATDDQALTTSALPRLHLQRDSATCRLTSIRFGLGDG